jgi:hypothetical protein
MLSRLSCSLLVAVAMRPLFEVSLARLLMPLPSLSAQCCNYVCPLAISCQLFNNLHHQLWFLAFHGASDASLSPLPADG